MLQIMRQRIMTTALPSQPSRGIGDVLRILTILIISTTASQGATCQSARARAIKIVGQIQRADYEGDRAALKRLYQDLSPFADDKELGAKVRYWRGFALWRRALIGFGDSVDRSELEQDLKQAVSEFDAATAKEPAFVDAKVGAGSCLFNLVFMYQKDAGRLREFLVKASVLLKEAEAVEPENPRLLWVLGANRWNNPLERGGAQDNAMETYQKGLKAAHAQRSMARDALTPSWGEPELLMSLAWSNLNRTSPDL